MPQFSYTAKDAKGSQVEGVMDAAARGAVVSRLQQMGYFPIRIIASDGAAVSSPKVTSKGSAKATAPEPAKPKASASAKPAASGGLFRKRLKTGDLATFNRQLADLIGAGVPLVKSMTILQKQNMHPELTHVVEEILLDVQGGTTFADALARHPTVFNNLYIALVKSGEAGGMLDSVLKRLADFSEMEEGIRSRVKSALAYPVVMVIACVGAIFVMFSFVIPRIMETFEQLGQTLPVMTQILIAISDFFQTWWMAVLGAVILGGFALRQYARSAAGRVVWDHGVLKLPVFGEVVRKREAARFARTLGSLLQNGVPILTALDIVKEVADNSIFKGEVDRIVEAITQGSGVADPLRTSVVFPAVAVNMIAVGEETGRLPEVLIRVGETYEVEVERSMRTLTSLLEPIIILVMGVIVAFIVISLLLPIFTMDPGGSMG